jgi:hypothetical protein
VIGSNAVNSNEFITLSQATSTSRLAISLTTTGSSGPATYNNTTGVFNIPEYAGTVNPSAREIETFIATASQTTFTVTGGYTVGLVDVFINGVRLTSSDFVATNGTTVVLTVGTMVNNIVDIIKYTSGIVNSISGSGTTNELAYFTASTTIASLTTATYPSLTELSYVKGVTSSIQTQLNGKQAAGTYVTSVTGTSPIVSSGGTTPAISIPVATTSVNGYLSSTDWTTFNGKQNALTNPVTGTGTTNYLPKFTGSTTIGNSLVFDDGTNVGINTASPIYILDAYSTGTGTARIRIQGTTNFAVTQAQNSSGILYMGIDSSTAGGFGFGNYSRLILSTNNYPLVFGVNSAESMRIWGATGNVNIGTTPASDAGFKLDVNGTGRFTTSSSGNIFTIGTTYAGGRNIQIGVSDGSILPTASAYINDNTGVGVYIGDNSASTKGLYVKYGGDVGIGTASPASQSTGATTGILDVSAAAGGNLVLHRTGSSDTALFSILKASNGTYIDSVGAATAANNAIYFRTNNINADQTSVTTALTIASTGVATFSSSVDLVTIFNSNTNKPYIRFDESGAAKLFIGERSTVSGSGGTGYDFYTVSSNDIRFFTGSSSTTRLCIATSGNVLIGTTTDSSGKLQVLGADNAIVSQIKSASSMLQIYTYFSAYGGPIIQALNTAGNYVGLRIESSLVTFNSSITAVGATLTGTVTITNATNLYTPSVVREGTTGNAFFQYNGTDTRFVSLNGAGSIAFRNNANTTNLLVISDAGIITSLPTYNNTTGVAANVQVDSNGYFARSTVSSQRFKENIFDWTGGLDIILSLKPRTFKYKKDYYDKADIEFLGLIAEEVSQVCPYLVDYENEDRTGQEENVRYANIVVPLIKAIQELKAELDELKSKN